MTATTMTSQAVRPSFSFGAATETRAGEFMGGIYGIETASSTRRLCARTRPKSPRRSAHDLARFLVVLVRFKNAAQQFARFVGFAPKAVVDARDQRQLQIALFQVAVLFLQDLFGFAQVAEG